MDTKGLFIFVPALAFLALMVMVSVHTVNRYWGSAGQLGPPGPLFFSTGLLLVVLVYEGYNPVTDPAGAYPGPALAPPADSLALRLNLYRGKRKMKMQEQHLPLHTLYIEDSDDDVVLVTAALRRSGYNVQARRVMTAAEMQQALREATWDVVLADYSLPGFGAPAALEILRQSGLDLPFIIVSGTIDEEQAVTALRAGAHDFITKGRLARLAPAIERERREAKNRRQHRQAEARLAITMDAMLEGAQIIGFDWRYLYVNAAVAAQGHKAKDALLGQTMMQAYPGIERTQMFATLQHCMAQRVAQRLENEFTLPDGSKGWFDLNIQPVPEGLFILSRDVTERKRAENDLRQAEAKYRTLIEQIPAITYAATVDSTQTLYVSPQIETLGYTPAEYQGDPELWLKIIHPDDRERVAAESAELRATGQSFRSEYRVLDRWGRERWLRHEAVVVSDEAGHAFVWQGIMLDITERKQAEAQIQRQLQQLAALRSIDIAISTSLDVRLTLDVLLDQVMAQLGVHAADVFLLEPRANTLAYAAGRGFQSDNFQGVRLRLGEGRAGQAALERRLIMASDIGAAHPPSRRTGLLSHDHFVSYYGVPLIAKGQVLGVLEVFHRTPLQPDPEWLQFLEALAGQAAIAIENAWLFDGLQRSHQDLILAYDATIEGWSRALDLRDRETEGHSQRVMELTLRLARAMDISEDELVHVRRGALLHDIGKMGVPDSILLKPGSLTDEEWVIMRRHPTHAYELLSPIAYLRPALDIPYCHHEKWDGSGYPRGLSGEQIPLAARLFAVVDVWDALRSDRPYRLAWPAGRALEHVRSLSGSHFDPRAVEAFLRVIS